MSDLSRVGVAIDADLLTKFDALIEKRGYTNRSEAFRDLIRDELIEKTWESPEANVVGTVTLVYDHHVRMLNEKLTDLQHDHHRSETDGHSGLTSSRWSHARANLARPWPAARAHRPPSG